ncbi:hypothetical protein BH23ACT9_BH23ACT9_07320 [soil metagenome]
MPGWVSTADWAAAPWQALTLEDGDRAIVAVAGESDTPDAAALLIRDPEGQHSVAGAVLAEGPRTLPFPRFTGLAPVDGIADTFDANFFFPLIEPVGLATVQQEGDAASWHRGRSIGWLVGDGRRLWLAGGPGDAIFIRDNVAMISVTPALD